MKANTWILLFLVLLVPLGAHTSASAAPKRPGTWVTINCPTSIVLPTVVGWEFSGQGPGTYTFETSKYKKATIELELAEETENRCRSSLRVLVLSKGDRRAVATEELFVGDLKEGSSNCSVEYRRCSEEYAAEVERTRVAEKLERERKAEVARKEREAEKEREKLERDRKRAEDEAVWAEVARKRELNCKRITGRTRGFDEAVASELKMHPNNVEFVRVEWSAGCVAVLYTYSGVVKCTVTHVADSGSVIALDEVESSSGNLMAHNVRSCK